MFPLAHIGLTLQFGSLCCSLVVLSLLLLLLLLSFLLFFFVVAIAAPGGGAIHSIGERRSGPGCHCCGCRFCYQYMCGFVHDFMAGQPTTPP